MLDITTKRRHSVSFLLLVFVCLYGVPVGLDLITGVPEYRNTPGFAAPAESEAVSAIYDLFVLACPPFWWLFARVRRREPQRSPAMPGKQTEKALWLFLSSPLIALFFAPQPSVYLSYGAPLGNMSAAAWEFHAIIGSLTILSVIAGACLLLIRTHFGRTCWLTLPFMTLAMWLQGKRAIVALCFLLIWVITWMRGSLTRSKLVAAVGFTVAVFGSYVAWYQVEFRPLLVTDTYSAYETSRIEYGRDHDLKAAILCELSDGNLRILDFRGQSMLFSLLMYVPRSYWPEKPWPYAVYMTAYALRSRVTDRGWGLTTSFLDETVANFGWTGFLIGPFILGMMCRLCDHNPDPLAKLVGILILCLLITVQLTAFAPVAIAWAIYLAWSRSASQFVSRKFRPHPTLSPQLLTPWK